MSRVTVHLRIRRKSGWRDYAVQVPPEAYVIDAIETAGAEDASLLYRHSCHHASCGSCGIRINGREALPCITPVADFPANTVLRLEALRNFPVIGDLLVDFGPFMKRLDSVGMPLGRRAEALADETDERQDFELIQAPESEAGGTLFGFSRLENCIECGLCVSACPVAGLDAQYQGPAALAAAARTISEPRKKEAAAVIALVDQPHGIWRCHAAFECSDVCPAGVDPAREIMGLRGRLLRSPTGREPKGSA